MSKETYRVSLEKEQLVFSAAHFITFGDNVCEQLHGHNYRVKCSVSGGLEQNGYVVDFIALRDSLMEIVGTLDHRMLLPTNHPTISVEKKDGEVLVRFDDRRWIFPEGDCVILPIANTTAELLANYIGRTLISKLATMGVEGLSKVVVSVDENHSQWGVCEIEV